MQCQLECNRPCLNLLVKVITHIYYPNSVLRIVMHIAVRLKITDFTVIAG
jgi:hypothetical protein